MDNREINKDNWWVEQPIEKKGKERMDKTSKQRIFFVNCCKNVFFE